MEEWTHNCSLSEPSGRRRTQFRAPPTFSPEKDADIRLTGSWTTPTISFESRLGENSCFRQESNPLPSRHLSYRSSSDFSSADDRVVLPQGHLEFCGRQMQYVSMANLCTDVTCLPPPPPMALCRVLWENRFLP